MSLGRSCVIQHICIERQAVKNVDVGQLCFFCQCKLFMFIKINSEISTDGSVI